ncbi:MAG TPA: sulfoxide reductase heme-binding subunit YedZ [Gammaproteobacteria bacterium]|nr:sulfoxide reductase heme-binding subunit YedZ [Gammaproteobacteria bacterium]
MNETQVIRWALKPVLFVLCLVPVLLLAWRAWQGSLGANPVETLSHETGAWALRMLLLTLTVTPLRRLTGWQPLIRFRRMLGLSAFFYACLHITVYLVFDQFFDWDEIVKDIVKRPYVTVGFTAFVLLLPLAVTSTKGMMRRLGRRWARLHQLVYVAATAGVLHFLWLVKADVRDPLYYAVALLVLLLFRVWWARRGAAAVAAPGRA